MKRFAAMLFHPQRAPWLVLFTLLMGLAVVLLLPHSYGRASKVMVPAPLDPTIAKLDDNRRAEGIARVLQASALNEPTPELCAAVARFKDTTVPLDVRRCEIEAMGKKADERFIRVLMALGNEKTYLNWAAIEALGTIPNEYCRPDVIEYLKSKLSDPDARVLCSALRSLALQACEAAIPDIAATMEHNRVREDGFQEMVLGAGVTALEQIWSPRIVPVLAAELERSDEKGWSLQYGSHIVAALRRIGSAEGRAAAAAYAGRLAARRPDDPIAGAYFAKKIAEAQAAAQ